MASLFPQCIAALHWVCAQFLVSFLRSIANNPHLFPVLHMVSGRVLNALFEKVGSETIESLVRVRSKAYNIDVAIDFETQS